MKDESSSNCALIGVVITSLTHGYLTNSDIPRSSTKVAEKEKKITQSIRKSVSKQAGSPCPLGFCVSHTFLTIQDF